LTGWRPAATAPDLSPVPVPPISQAPADLERLHLAQTEPLDDPAAVALQLALITGAVAELVERVDQLERLQAGLRVLRRMRHG
jgi:hypothetical protein